MQKTNHIYRFVWLLLPLYLLELILCDFYSWKSYLARPAFLFVHSAWVCSLLYFFVSLIGTIGCKWRKQLQTTLYVIAAVFVWVFSATDIFLYFHFWQTWNADTIRLLLDTNPIEAKDFLFQYVVKWSTLWWMVVITGLFAVVYYVMHLFSLIKFILPDGILRWANKSRIAIIWGICVVGLTIYWGPAYTFDVEDNNDYSHRFLCKPQVFQTYQSAVALAKNKEYGDICLYMQQGVEATCMEEDSLHVVLIIGESFIRCHSSLYGYPLCTNPQLSQLDSLICFRDVTTSHNLTYMAMTNMFSLASTDEERQWYEAPMFPALFRTAGYQVVYYSNQFSRSPSFDLVKAVMGWINRRDILDALFDYQNDQLYELDGDYLDDYPRLCTPHESGSHVLTIAHVRGQHYTFSERFPKEFGRFQVEDVERKELNQEQRQLIADYDNATLYNDSIVAAIIQKYQSENAVILYLSDHGEVVYDDGETCYRSVSFDQPVSEIAIHTQIDIPFMVYATPRYRNMHPEIMERLRRAADLPFQSDDLPHILIHLAGIDSPWYNAVRDPLSDQYNSRRKRFFNGNYPYPE